MIAVALIDPMGNRVEMQGSNSRASGSESMLILALGTFIGHTAGCRPGRIQDHQTNGGEHIAVSCAATREYRQQLRADGFRYVREFSVLPSHQHPRWLFPVSDRHTMLNSLQIYAPLAPRGRLLKASLKAMVACGWKGWNPKFLVASREPLPLEKMVRDVTGEETPVFSLSLGNLQNLRALTVQVMRQDGGVLGYIKLPLNEAAAARIRNEANVLIRVWDRYPPLRPQIPQVLYSGPWNDGFVLFQSSGPNSAGPRRFCDLHARFLEQLWDVEPVMESCEALIEEASQRWRQTERVLGAEWCELANACLEKSYQLMKGTSLRCGVMHGDFVPWNTRRDGDRLFVFDWESARLKRPRLWDIFHFREQTASLLHEKHIRYSDLGLASPRDDGSYLLYSLHALCDAVEGGQQVEAKINVRKRRMLRSMQAGGACPAL